MAEGSMRENLDKAAYYRPSNLTAIIDVNRLGQRGPTKLEGGHGRLPAACRGVQLQYRHHRRPRHHPVLGQSMERLAVSPSDRRDSQRRCR